MKTVFQALLSACANGGAVLATVVQTSGSSPRRAGACMAVGPEGRLAGTIGGGRLELEASGQSRAHLLEKKNGTAQFSLQDAAAATGMVCGGDVEVLYTYLPPEEETLQVLSLVEACLQTRAPGRLVLPFAAGIGFVNADGRVFGLKGISAAQLPEEAGVVEISGGMYFALPLTAAGTVFLIGGGHVGQALARLLPWLDFPYDVADDRPDFADPKLFPGAGSVQHLAYTDLSRLSVGPDDYIVIVTDGHRGDYEAEKWALGTPAAYIGAVGSQKKTAYVNSLLREDGFQAADIARITAPIGIPIGSDTPEEIAVSIAAQLIEKRAAKRSQ